MTNIKMNVTKLNEILFWMNEYYLVLRKFRHLVQGNETSQMNFQAQFKLFVIRFYSV